MSSKITIYVVLMSGEVLNYTCVARVIADNGNKTKFLTHKSRIQDMVLKHLELTKENYIVKLIHDDDEEKLQNEHIERVEKWKRQGNKLINENTYILPGDYDFNAIKTFENQRDKNRYYENGSIVRAFVDKFNFKKEWALLKDK